MTNPHSDPPFRPLACWLGLITLAILATGCRSELDTEYATLDGPSLNGLSVFRALLEDRGHEVRLSVRLDDSTALWSQVLIRFAPAPGRPPSNEAEWYRDWLLGRTDRSVLYIPRDCDLESEYWDALLASDAAQDDSARAEFRARRDSAAQWVTRLPPADPRGQPGAWSILQTGAARYAQRLSGPWTKGLHLEDARLPIHDLIAAGRCQPLLLADEQPFVVENQRPGHGRTLVIANGSFLLNAGLVNPARRRLAERVADWIGDEKRRIAFVLYEGVTDEAVAASTLWALLGRVPALKLIAVQLGIMGLVAALARFPRLGRARTQTRDWSGRPAAHAEALGLLLARTRDQEKARAILAEYDARRRREDRRRLSTPAQETEKLAP